MSETLYLYGFVPGETRLPAAGLEGAAGGAVGLLGFGEFQAAVSWVATDDYRPDVLEERIKDLQWLAEQGVAHERVVAWFVDHAQILPVRLLTLYSSAEALEEETRARAGLIGSQLRRFSGVREWDLKVSYRAERLSAHIDEVSAEVAALDEAIAAAGPGRRFLLEKKRADILKGEVARAARRLASRLLDSAQPLALDVVTVPLPQVSAELPVVLSAALLVRSENEQRLREEMQRRAAGLAELGVEVSFSGPWAPYRFMGSGDGGDPGAEHVGA